MYTTMPWLVLLIYIATVPSFPFHKKKKEREEKMLTFFASFISTLVDYLIVYKNLKIFIQNFIGIKYILSLYVIYLVSTEIDVNSHFCFVLFFFTKQITLTVPLPITKSRRPKKNGRTE